VVARRPGQPSGRCARPRLDWLRPRRLPAAGYTRVAVSDTPFPLPEDGVASRLVAAFDADAKIPRALDALGPVDGRDVVLVDADRGYRARQLAGMGARVTALVAAPRPTDDPGAGEGIDAGGHPDPGHAARAAASGGGAGGDAHDAAELRLRASIADLDGRVRVATGDAAATGLPDACADVVVALWTAYRPPAEAAVAEADRILRPDGRLLVVHDYGRDDHVRAEPAIADDTVAWSRRDGWYLTNGFRVRVIHAFWTFADLDEAHELLAAAFGEAGSTLADGLTRPRISHNVAVYHRTRGAGGPSPATRPEGAAAQEPTDESWRGRQPASRGGGGG
jgi:SAM-dependent methyltransferase